MAGDESITRHLAKVTRHCRVTLISLVEESISVGLHGNTRPLKYVVVNYQNDGQKLLGIKAKS